MTSRSSARRATLVVAAVAATLSALPATGATGATSATSATRDTTATSATRGTSAVATVVAAQSTPVPITTPDGLLMSYVVNATVAGPQDIATVKRAVRLAGGVVVQAWPQIGVVIAHSDRAAFRSRVVALSAGTVGGAEPTRTVAVTEGTPAAVAAPWSVTGTARAAAGAVGAPRVSPAGRHATSVAAVPVPDPREGSQWDLTTIKADTAHLTTDGSPTVVVGVLDSGVDASHPDLAPNIDAADSVNCTDAGRPDTSATGWLPTTSPHGTHVAGTIAAARNGIGIVGVAPGVRLASVKVVNDAGFIYPEYAICGFVWAGLRGMEVTNSSYFVDPFEFYCDDQPEQSVPAEALRRAVAWSTSRGVVHAAAAGNSSVDLARKTTDFGSPDDGTPVARTLNPSCHDLPAELPGVAAVSALARVGTTTTGTLASYSNRGNGVIDVAAPGSAILSTLPGNGYGTLSGTSMASPHVAGVLALMRSAHPGYKPAQLLTTLAAEADAQACSPSPGGPACLGGLALNSYYGNGVVDAASAVR